MNEIKLNTADNIKIAITAAILIFGIVAGYAQLTDAVKANSKAIQKIADLMLNDTRQDVRLDHVEQEVKEIKADLRDKNLGK